MNVRCTRAVESDEPFFRRLLMETLTEELAAAAWPEPMRSHLLEMQYRIRRDGIQFAYGGAEILLAKCDEEPVGWAVVQRSAENLHIVDIAVLPARRSTGIGTAILSGLLEQADRSRLPASLNVNLGNRAIRLYERLGFSRTGGSEVQHFMTRMPAETTTAAGKPPSAQ